MQADRATSSLLAVSPFQPKRVLGKHGVGWHIPSLRSGGGSRRYAIVWSRMIERQKRVGVNGGGGRQR